MTGAAAKALHPTDARRIEGIMRRLGALWEASALAGIPVVLNPRLSRTLGRLVGRPWRIELGPRALVGSKRLREVVTHEARMPPSIQAISAPDCRLIAPARRR
jgi:hypothetical protein